VNSEQMGIRKEMVVVFQKIGLLPKISIGDTE
jgi:hypothetical protein